MNMNSEDNKPIPQGKYVPATRFEQTIYTAGMTPRKNGELIQTGKVKTSEPISTYKEAVRQAAKNALIAIKDTLQEREKIKQVLLMNVFIHAEESFEAHARLADFASEYLFEQVGEIAISSRAAVGVASLPGNAPVEIQMVVAVTDEQ